VADPVATALRSVILWIYMSNNTFTRAKLNQYRRQATLCIRARCQLRCSATRYL